jgi:hypothetical protein
MTVEIAVGDDEEFFVPSVGHAPFVSALTEGDSAFCTITTVNEKKKLKIYF